MKYLRWIECRIYGLIILIVGLLLTPLVFAQDYTITEVAPGTSIQTTILSNNVPSGPVYTDVLVTGVYHDEYQDAENANGLIVGCGGAVSNTTRALLWTNGATYDLNFMIGAASNFDQLESAVAIDNQGDILAYGLGASPTALEEFMLTPTPELNQINTSAQKAPELDASTGFSSIALLIGLILSFRSRSRSL